MTAPEWNDDFSDFVDALVDEEVERYKLWPTQRDVAQFVDVSRAGSRAKIEEKHPPRVGRKRVDRPVMVDAYVFFHSKIEEWMSETGDAPGCAKSLRLAIMRRLEVVQIDLEATENPQEIFETLNARGAQLTAADLIKNFVFQRLTEAGDEVENAYDQYWKEFETGFWEGEVSAGRVRHPRSSMFLNHWLIARTGEEILAREVFQRFKVFADFDSGVHMRELLGLSEHDWQTFVQAHADVARVLED